MDLGQTIQQIKSEITTPGYRQLAKKTLVFCVLLFAALAVLYTTGTSLEHPLASAAYPPVYILIGFIFFSVLAAPKAGSFAYHAMEIKSEAPLLVATVVLFALRFVSVVPEFKSVVTGLAVISLGVAVYGTPTVKDILANFKLELVEAAVAFVVIMHLLGLENLVRMLIWNSL